MDRVAKLYHKSTPQISPAADAQELLAAIDAFLSKCARPAVLEYGEEMIPLVPGQYAVEARSGRLWIEVWTETRSISRRILAIEGRTAGALDCAIHRFGGKPGKLTFLDIERPQTAHKSLRGARQNFAEQFRRMLFRQFPGWEIKSLSCAMDLQRSFSPVFPRARLSRGNQIIAAMACPRTEDEPGVLTFALIWHDYVRTHARKDISVSLCLFLPEAAGNLTSHRLRWLNSGSLQTRLFRFNLHGSAGEVDPQDLGNLETRLRAASGIEQESKPDPATTNSLAAGSEKLLEVAVRRNIAAVDPTLLPDPIHGQVLTFAAGDRDVIDLVAVSPHGALGVLELKVSEDIHLPLQALDYWMRIRWHAERNELQYLFPGIPLAHALPKLLLVAPAMSFHSSNAVVLRYFSPEIEVERVGVNLDWQHRFKVILRLRGADVPISHGVVDEFSRFDQH